MAITLTHPDITRARTSDTARGPVNLTHPGRLTYANLPGQWHIGHPTGLLTVTAITCDCGADGPCEHIDAVRLHAGQIAAAFEPVRQQQQLQQQDREAAPVVDPFVALDPFADATDAMGTRFTPPLTRAEAAERLGVKVATIARYLTRGTLARHDSGVSAASVEAYRARRDANNQRNRGQVSDVDRELSAADRAVKRARRLEAEAERLRDQYKAACERYGVGAHDGWALGQKAGRAIRDGKAIDADYAARGKATPMTTSAPSWVLTRAA